MLNAYLSKTDKQTTNHYPFVFDNLPSVSDDADRNMPSVCHKTPFSRFSGFSLIELVVTLVIASIIVAWGVPNFRTFIQNNSMTGQVNELVGDLNYARSEAVKRGINIGVCISSDGATCVGANWTLGRIVFADTNNNGAFDAGEEVLRSRESVSGTIGTTLTSTGANPLIITSRGSVAAALQYRFCDSRGVDHARTVAISAIGQTQTFKGTPVLGAAIACP